MSKFYGTIQGNRGCATRGGSLKSGFRASAQSYDGSVITVLSYDDENQLMVRLGTNENSSCYTDWSHPEFRGTFEELKELIQLSCDIKNGKVKVVARDESTQR